MVSNLGWHSIFSAYGIYQHNFETAPFLLTTKQIQEATNHLSEHKDKDVRLLCKQDTRSSRPTIFAENNLFLLLIRNNEYAILQGEGYVDIPNIALNIEAYESQIDFYLHTAITENVATEYLDFAHASGLISHFLNDGSLFLTMHGHQHTQKFPFQVGNQKLEVNNIQIYVDAVYESQNQVALVKIKQPETDNTIISSELYYPYHHYSKHINKRLSTLLFEYKDNEYKLWESTFDSSNDYNSIRLVKSRKYKITQTIRI